MKILQAITVLFCLFIPAFAQPVAPPRAGVGQISRKLTLQDAIALALKENVEIEMVKADTATASAALRGTRGFFDPVFRWQPSLESRNTPASSVLQGANGKLAEHFHSENFRFRQQLPWNGAGLALDFENSRLSSSNPFISLNPYITSRLLFTFTQPLLRGRETDRERTEIKVRRKQVDISEIDFELKTIDVINRVEQAYWDLVAARQDADVKADTAEWARQQLDRNKRMIAAGNLAPVEVSASEAELQRRLDAWYASIGVITESENALKTLLTSGREDPLWSEAIIPVEESPLAPPESDDVPQAVAAAIKERAELRAIGERQQVNQIEQKLNADLVKPQLNLVAGYGSTGLAGSLRAGDNPFTSSNAALYDRLNRLSAQAGLPPVAAPNLGGAPAALIGGYGSTLSNLFGGNYQTVQLGLQMDFTFRNSTAEANLAQSAIAERRLKLQRSQAELTVEAQVRNAIQAIQTARQRIASAEAGARAAKEKLESETRLFQTGESTNFLVLTRQNEYADARHRLLVANLDQNKAVARLEQAVGSTLRSHKVTLK